MALLYKTTPLTALQAAHLLRRATFGPTKDLIDKFTNLTPSAAITKLFADDQVISPPPLDPDTNATFFNLPFNTDKQGKHNTYLKSWWLGNMINKPGAPGSSPQEKVTLSEKMTLFLQNVLVTTASAVTDNRYMYRYYSLLRTYALGNYKNLVIAMTKDPAMLRFLNGNTNTKTKPNENYARELQELFTIGRIKPNGKLNYTEDDVKAAARVLTGWDDTGFRNTTSSAITTTFSVTNHDTTSKQFSSYYQNKLIAGRNTATAGDDELKDLIEMIFAQTETAKNLCRELYRWFVAANITTDVETNVITPLANIFRNNNYEIKPVLTAIFKMQHFYDEKQVGSIIKSPIDFVVSTLRYFELSPADMSSKTTDYYSFLSYVLSRTREQTQEVLMQPNVFGWAPYYDTAMYKMWINATTLSYRNKFTDDLVTGAFKVNSIPQQIDTIAWVDRIPDASNPVTLIDTLTATLFAVPITQVQKDYLIDQVLIPGLPRIEWTIEWNNYKANPTDTKIQKSVRGKLNTLFIYMLRMAEYQMG